ncbi:hypothetical protein BDW74DRAFT_183716 [Aspergillus multicolor]|uniref:F-box protein n=1 Tax=Aspergillus multicolor TaxID=41759 RepID=UPI003CCDDA88
MASKISPLKPATPRVMRAQIDLAKKLNFDCHAKVFENLSIYDLARCQLVSKQWRANALEWITGAGLAYHFPIEHKRFIKKFEQEIGNENRKAEGKGKKKDEDEGKSKSKGPEPYQVWDEFGECAYEQARTDAWLCGRVTSDLKLNNVSHFSLNGKFIVRRLSPASREQDKVQTPARPLTIHEVCAEAETLFLIVQCPEYIAKLRKVLPSSKRLQAKYEEPEHMEFMADIQTGKDLWSSSRRYNRTDWEQQGFSDAVVFGWEKIYRFATNNDALHVHSIRTGEELYTLPFRVGGLDSIVVLRLDGREVLLTVRPGYVDTNAIVEIRLTDGETGKCLQSIVVRTMVGAREQIVSSNRHGEVAFALVSYGEDDDGEIVRIRKYAWDAPRELFIPQDKVKLELLKFNIKDLSLMGVPEVDPFRGDQDTDDLYNVTLALDVDDSAVPLQTPEGERYLLGHVDYSVLHMGSTLLVDVMYEGEDTQDAFTTKALID